MAKQTLEEIWYNGKTFFDIDMDKKFDHLVRYHKMRFLSYTYSMFDYKNLPESIPKRSLILQLQCGGFAGIMKVKGDLYSLQGGLGGKPDAYYMPTILTVANPALNMSRMAEIDENCVVIPNDPFYMGLLPLVQYYAEQLAVNDVTKHIVSINSRASNVFLVDNDAAKQSVETFQKNLYKGKLASYVSDKSFREKMVVLPYSDVNGSRIYTELIEDRQYTKASFFNEIGLQANYNMKREAINSQEAQLGDEALFPFVDAMFNTQKEAIDKVNKMFGTNIEIVKNSSWDKMTEKELMQSSQLDKPNEEGSDNEAEGTDNRPAE